MLKNFEVIGLNGKNDHRLIFNRDLNILTGKNGSGKTTILKLIWYCLSGNIDRIRQEIIFQRATLETTTFKLTITSNPEIVPSELSFELIIGDSRLSSAPSGEQSLLALPSLANLGRLIGRPTNEGFDQVKSTIGSLSDSSLFFPTFRRIEGGYSAERRRRATNRLSQNPLQEALSDFSDYLENGNNHFVASVSTDDIVNLLTSKFAEISEHTNRLHVELSESITRTIREYEQQQGAASVTTKLLDAQSTLTQIQQKISDIEQRRDLLLKPFAVLNTLINLILKHRGIKVTEAITFGETTQSITSDKLSAGEKQMLSFLCYNAFNTNACIFIDEPEISLHMDWQRTLFPTLMEQSTSNQFIVATHSPFIYSKFPDKELVLNPDKGEN